jgi:single-strand DNA-binding protein
MYLNKAIIIGNLTREPEKKALPSGIAVTSFSLATNRVWKDKDGAKQESVDYHNIVVFGRQAETTSQYLKKGQSALVEGRIQTRSWDGNDGVKRYRTEIVADRVQFGPKTGEGGGIAPTAAAPAEAPQDAPSDGGGQIDYPEDEINPEDIPF